MQVVLNESEVKKAVEYYLLKLHGLTVQMEHIVFKSKQDKAINLNGVVVILEEKGALENESNHQ
jgi:hypothetical protein